MVGRFFSGFGFMLAGKRLLSSVPGIKFWIIIPLIIDFILLFGGIYFGSNIIQGLVYKATLLIFTNAEGLLYQLTYYPVLILFWMIFVVLYLYVVYILASVVASPFYAIIAEKTLNHLGHQEISDRKFVYALKLAVKMLWVSILRGSLMLLLGALLFVVSFVPGLNLIAGFCVFILIALDMMDYSLEAKGLGLRSRLQLLKNNFPEICGMGAFVGLTVLIPGLILLVMPVAVVGAAAQLNIMLNKANERNDARVNT